MVMTGRLLRFRPAKHLPNLRRQEAAKLAITLASQVVSIREQSVDPVRTKPALNIDEVHIFYLLAKAPKHRIIGA